VKLLWRPFLLDIGSFLGTAEVGARDNKVKPGTNRRSLAQWRVVKYAYANLRRYAAQFTPPLTIFGTRQIWDTTIPGIAMLFAAAAGQNELRAFQQHVWPRFWRRELDVEDLEAVTAALQ
jgi:hypothetical protein